MEVSWEGQIKFIHQGYILMLLHLFDWNMVHQLLVLEIWQSNPYRTLCLSSMKKWFYHWQILHSMQDSSDRTQATTVVLLKENSCHDFCWFKVIMMLFTSLGAVLVTTITTMTCFLCLRCLVELLLRALRTTLHFSHKSVIRQGKCHVGIPVVPSLILGK
jgi:hypothetical protein